MEKFSEAKEAARKAIEERKQGGKKSEGTGSALELMSPPHQATPTSPPSSVGEGKREEGGGKVMVNGDSSAGRKVTSTSSAEVNQLQIYGTLISVLYYCVL